MIVRNRRQHPTGDGAGDRAHGGDSCADGGLQTEYLPVVSAACADVARGIQSQRRAGNHARRCAAHDSQWPVAQKIGIHGGNGCFGPGFRANASIGRAIRLMLLNLGGGIPGVGSATVFSTPLRYTACLAENVERSPGRHSRCRAAIHLRQCDYVCDGRKSTALLRRRESGSGAPAYRYR